MSQHSFANSFPETVDDQLLQALRSVLRNYSTCAAAEVSGVYSNNLEKIPFTVSFTRDKQFLLTWTSARMMPEPGNEQSLERSILIDDGAVKYRAASGDKYVPLTSEIGPIANGYFARFTASILFNLVQGKREMSVFDDTEFVDEPKSFTKDGELLVAVYSDRALDESDDKLILYFDLPSLTLASIKRLELYDEKLLRESNANCINMGFPARAEEVLASFSSQSFVRFLSTEFCFS